MCHAAARASTSAQADSHGQDTRSVRKVSSSVVPPRMATPTSCVYGQAASASPVSNATIAPVIASSRCQPPTRAKLEATSDPETTLARNSVVICSAASTTPSTQTTTHERGTCDASLVSGAETAQYPPAPMVSTNNCLCGAQSS